MKGLFVCGTDTGVGKTEVACFIARLWRSRGLTVGVCKPAETGVDPADRGSPRDARALATAGGDSRPIEEICPFTFAESLAPSVAAERAKSAIDPDKLTDAIAAAAQGRDRVVVEAAGGLLVPYAPGFDGIDLLARSGLPAVLVGRLGLGTINHTRLSVEALRTRAIKIAAIVLSVGNEKSAPRVGNVAAETNPGVLAKLLPGMPVVVYPVVDPKNPPRVPALEALII
jgi:dethiobiotin synthetase